MGLFSSLASFGLGFLGYKSQKDSAKSAEHAAERQYHQTREDLSPWRIAGERGLKGLEDTITDYSRAIIDPGRYYTESPGFNALVRRQTENLGKAYSARGAIDTGEYPEEVGKMINYLTMQDYGNYLNRVGGLANLYGGLSSQGQSAAAATGTAGQWAAGQKIDAGYQGSNAYTNFLQNIGGTLNQEYMMNALANRGALGGDTTGT